jgi:hypothetical protein
VPAIAAVGVTGCGTGQKAAATDDAPATTAPEVIDPEVTDPDVSDAGDHGSPVHLHLPSMIN